MIEAELESLSTLQDSILIGTEALVSSPISPLPGAFASSSSAIEAAHLICLGSPPGIHVLDEDAEMVLELCRCQVLDFILPRKCLRRLTGANQHSISASLKFAGPLCEHSVIFSSRRQKF